MRELVSSLSVCAGQDAVLGEVVDGDSLSTRVKAAAILVFVFGQQLENVAGLTWDDITVTDELVTVTLGTFAIALNEPLDAPWARPVRQARR